ncbi:MAG: radical SAM protein, partial [Oscillospiraceae bacterium]|nr:radical SAM protein [Oscillospiraceae bacterium]
VHIGGGEPFLNFEKLLKVCESARRSRVSIDYIETNGSWHADERSSSEKLQRLLEAGVDCLLVSLDPFHNEFVPYEKIKGLLGCCKKNGMGTFLWHSKFEPIVAQLDEGSAHSLPEYERLFGDGFVESVANAYGLGYNGRALRILEKIAKEKKPGEHFLKENSCKSQIASPHHFHVDYNGDFIPPSCNGFRANVFELCGEGLDGEKYKYFTAVAKGGLGSFYAEAQKLGFVPCEKGYVSKCAFCFDMKKFICEAALTGEGSEPPDVGPAGFFAES